MSPLIKKALVAVAAKQVFDKVMQKREESRRSSKKRIVPIGIAALGGIAGFLLYRARQET